MLGSRTTGDGRVHRVRRAATLGAPLLIAAVITASAPGLLHIRIRPGDTLTAIAERYHTSVAALIALNHLPGNGNLIYAGAELAVPVRTHRAARPRAEERRTARPGRYTVRPGDTLDGIAARFGVSPAAIARRNHLPASLMVVIGQRLAIPGRRDAGPAHRGEHRAAHRRIHRVAHRRAARGARRHAPPPRPQSIATVEALIVRTARRYRVDPDLALAIAWQESGFNQAEVSPTGAVGVMQIEPATDRYISRYVVGRPMDPAVLRDNVTVGVALIHELLRATGGDVRRAVAGYYQGLGSVQARGMLAETRLYVADVLALRQRLRGG